MRLFRYGPAGAERPAILDTNGIGRDISSLVPDIAGQALSRSSLAKLRTAPLHELPPVPAGARIGACVGSVGNFIAVGLNYADHAAESGMPAPPEPIIFNKAPSCIVGPNDDVRIPPGSAATDWEVELAIVIGEEASYVSEAQTRDVIAGYCVCNDVSERTYQLQRGGGQWAKGKGCPTFGPLGPWLVTQDEIDDVQALSLWLDVNGERTQTGTTGSMIFSVYTLVSHISQFMILKPGDVITTGTPPGVGMGHKPPRFLKAGDEMRLGIAGLGEQHQRVVGG